MDSKKRKIASDHDIIDLCEEEDVEPTSHRGSSTQVQYSGASKAEGKADQKPAAKSSSKSVQPKKTSKGEGKVISASSTASKISGGSSGSSEWPSFQLATYNIWFENVHLEERMTAIAENLLGVNNADSPLLFIGLQEMTHDLSPLLEPFLESSGYGIVYQPFQTYGTALGIHEDCTILKSGFVRFRTTIMDRGMLYAITRLPQSEQEILVVTTHLESYLGPTENGARQRQEQVKEVKQFCEKHLAERPALQLAVVMGDLNWDDERPRSSKGIDVSLMSLLDEQWKDSWRETHPPKDTGYTYDSKMNPMLRGALRRRFDRCLLRPKTPTSVVVDETKIVGQQALPGLIWKKQYEYPPGNVVVSDREVCASDHFGLVVKVRTQR